MVAACACLALPSFLARADSKADPSFYVVKLVSFACAFSRESELGDSLLIQDIERHGGAFVLAPVDVSGAAATFARESVFYASRPLGAGLSVAVRDSLYRATQDRGLTFTAPEQVMTWLESDQPQVFTPEILRKLTAGARATATRDAIARAIHLGAGAGVDYLPAYLVLADGRVHGMYDREAFPQMGILRAQVSAHIAKLKT